MFSHATPDQLARWFTAFVLALLGIWQLMTPGCFGGIGLFFRRTRAALAPDQRERLTRVLDARTSAEGSADVPTRYAGVFTLVMAAVALIPWVPYVLTYAASCLGMAIATLTAYVQYRRSTERRVAPLMRRTPWMSLPPVAIAATAVCILGTAAFATLPQFRIAGIVVIAVSLALCAIAWRVAIAPSVLFGDDPQLEYLVDEHVRFCRANNLLGLACAPPTVLVMIGWASLPDGAHFFNAVTLAVCIAFAIVMVVSLNPLRKRLSFA
jgi:hypothetical protein